MMHRLAFCFSIAALAVPFGAASNAMAQTTRAADIAQAFADHCFSPRLTARTAQAQLGSIGARVDFYDLRPFTSAPQSPVTGAAATAGTDRRCEVSFDGAAPQVAQQGIATGLAQENLTDLVDVPAGVPITTGATYRAAVMLNPNRMAVVQSGVRDGAQGVETFARVERLIPMNEASQ